MTTHTQISLEVAITWISAWKEKTNIAGNEFRATLIPMTDVAHIMAEIGAHSVRTYNGFNPDTQQFKLILVGVDHQGNDIVAGPTAISTDPIYDMTLPCPDTCDINSPLFIAQMPLGN